MSYDSYEVPDGITPLVGYRGWLVKDGALTSAYPDIRSVEWPVGQPLQSECLPPTRRIRSDDRRVTGAPKHYWAPHIECTCGIYALHEYPFPSAPGRKAVKPWPDDAVTGMVHGWGRIIVGDKGFRSQYAKPIALVSRPRSRARMEVIEEVAMRYGLEIVDARDLRSRP